MTKPNPYAEVIELVRASMLNLGRAAAKLHDSAAGDKPPEYYAINRAWHELDGLVQLLNKKALGR